jgi:predicted enzyme related to lactoylglutathione lyase
MPTPLIEFPADDPERALNFWHALLGLELEQRQTEDGSGWEAQKDGLRIGVHERGRGPGDTGSLPYLTVTDMTGAANRVREHGGSVVHPAERWTICRDSEGNPFALATPGHRLSGPELQEQLPDRAADPGLRAELEGT